MTEIEKAQIRKTIKHLPLNEIDLMIDEYYHVNSHGKRNYKKFGLHLIKRAKYSKDWKRMNREKSRFTIIQLNQERIARK